MYKSQAQLQFEHNRADVERLLEIHKEFAGDDPGRKHGVAVLNKSSIVLLCAVWEAYCEDLVAEGIRHLVANVDGHDKLPKDLRKTIVSDLALDKNALAFWRLADDGWRTLLTARADELTEARNRKLNTPKSSNIRDLFRVGIGLEDVTTCWRWRKMSAKDAGKKLDEFVALRGSIAHRGTADDSVKKVHVTGFLNHVGRLVTATDDHVAHFIEEACGVPFRTAT